MTQTGKCKVVIVEDEGLVAADVRFHLEDAGYAVSSTADTGEGALHEIARTSPDIVVMDIHLKGDMDGIEAAKRVRQQFDLPVVYLTAYEDKETLERATGSRAYGYVKKPIAWSGLRGSIELALSRHREERYLREQRDWLSSSFAAVPDAVVVTDGLGRVSYMNPKAAELTGCDEASALGQPCSALLRLFYEQKGWLREELLPVEDLAPAAMLEGVAIPLPGDVCLAGPDGVIAIEGTVAPRWQDGRMVGTVVVFRDIGPRKLAERRKLEETKQEALMRLADGVSNRLNLEVGVVVDETAAVVQRLAAGSPVGENLKTLELAAMDALEVIGRLESFRQTHKIERQQFRINDLLSAMEQTWKERVPGFSLLLGAVATPVLADAYHLARALSLILQHARSSMEPGSGLTVETSRIVSPDAGGPWVRTRFAYTSRGETSDMLEHAFEPSCTGARTGLPAAYALIKDMGGFVTASLETVNTVLFEVYLSPVAVLEVDAEPRPVVLLIEPNWRVGCLLQQHFSEHAIDLLCVSNCQEARLAAGLYENNLSLVLANAAADDPEREELSADLAQARSGPRVRWLNGYQEESLDGPGTHFLSKWNLLEWARQEIADAAARKSIRETRIHVLTPAD